MEEIGAERARLGAQPARAPGGIRIRDPVVEEIEVDRRPVPETTRPPAQGVVASIAPQAPPVTQPAVVSPLQPSHFPTMGFTTGAGPAAQVPPVSVSPHVLSPLGVQQPWQSPVTPVPDPGAFIYQLPTRSTPPVEHIGMSAMHIPDVIAPSQPTIPPYGGIPISTPPIGQSSFSLAPFGQTI